jgi:hypothetical protein
MRLPLAAALLFGSCTAAWAECPVGDIEKALGAPLGTLKETELPVTDVQSTEGGVRRIYRRADGALDTLIRIDGGESGMDEMRLSIVGDGAYGTAHTRVGG